MKGYFPFTVTTKYWLHSPCCTTHPWGASLVAQWLRIHLPMHGTWVRALAWEDPTCHRATKPMHHNYWATTQLSPRALEPVSHNYWACVPQLLKPACPRARALQQEKPPQWEARTQQQRVAHARRNQRKPAHSNGDPTQPKIKIKNKLKRKKKDILEPILQPIVCTSHSPTPILPLPPFSTGKHWFVFYICESASFLLYSLVCCIF